ncbi:hypothetical protein K8I28_00860 [bacterium]|nr:hypothetical protein [bacterium]
MRKVPQLRKLNKRIIEEVSMHNIDDLTRYDIPESAIKCWQDRGITELLPFQEKAIQSFGLLDGKSLLVSAPTSSGKTLLSEIAAMRVARK